MDSAVVSTALSQMVDVSFKVAGPYLLVGLVVGSVMSLLQALTQLQEPALVFVSRLCKTSDSHRNTHLAGICWSST